MLEYTENRGLMTLDLDINGIRFDTGMRRWKTAFSMKMISRASSCYCKMISVGDDPTIVSATVDRNVAVLTADAGYLWNSNQSVE
jgi:hypothetical protein